MSGRRSSIAVAGAIAVFAVVLLSVELGSSEEATPGLSARAGASPERRSSSAELSAIEGEQRTGFARTSPREIEGGEPETRPEVPTLEPRTERFTVVLVDVRGNPVAGIHASVRFSPQISSSGPEWRPIVSLESVRGPRVTSGPDGIMAVDHRTEWEEPASAYFSFELDRGSPYALPDTVHVPAGETLRVVVEQGGSIEVRVLSTVSGIQPRIAPYPSRAWAGVLELVLSLHPGSPLRGPHGERTAVDTVRWDQLPPGTYEIRANTLCSFGRWELATLGDLRVEAGRPCRDPRLLAWSPFRGKDVMELRVIGPNGRPPRAIALHFELGDGSETHTLRVAYDGRPLPIVAPPGGESRLVLGARDAQSVRLPVERGSRYVHLEPRPVRSTRND
ncbi:MAG: hypothetical protein AAF726_02470 [Planctomycetota bacterium]